MSFVILPGLIQPPLTAGGVAYGTGSLAKVSAAGTAGQFLQSNGASPPSFATISAPASGLQLLAIVDATGASYASFDGYFTSTYDNYLIVASDFVDSLGGGSVNAQVAIASTYQTGAFYRASAIVSSSTSTTITGYAQTTNSTIQMVQVNSLTDTSGFYCYIYAPLSTVGPKVIAWNIVGQRYASNSIQQTIGIGSWGNSNAALSGIRFASVNGTWGTGKFRLYGLANT